jgi:predicted ABC-type ATPase
MNKYLYIISGCNGAGKTTASYTVLPEVLDCKEFVNAEEIAPDLAIQRVEERVQNGGHNIEEDVIKRRYVAGISNLFVLYMQEVDYWVIYDNSENPRKQIACGGKGSDTIIKEELLYSKIQSYVK